jgi:hypothetical protein
MSIESAIPNPGESIISKEIIKNLVDKIEWKQHGPELPEGCGFELISVDPGPDGNFSSPEIGEPVYATGGDRRLLGYACGLTEGLMVPVD